MPDGTQLYTVPSAWLQPRAMQPHAQRRQLEQRWALQPAAYLHVEQISESAACQLPKDARPHQADACIRSAA